MSQYLKDPDETLDFGEDWSDVLVEDETISASEWTVPEGLTAESDSNTDTSTTVWLSGGTRGMVYAVENEVTTTASRVYVRTIYVKVVER